MIALPHGTPRHRIPPQLAQIQIICRHMAVHITLYPLPTVRTISRLGVSESFLGRRAHSIQFVLEPHHIPEYSHWPLEPEQRKVVQGHRRFWQVPHIHDTCVVKVPLQDPRIWNQGAYTPLILPCRTRTIAASGRRPVRPRTSGTVSKSTTPSELRCTVASGAFQGTSSVTSKVMSDRAPTVASPSVAITQSTLTRWKNNPNTASQILSQPPNSTHEENPPAQPTARRHTEALKRSGPVTGAVSSEELPVSTRPLYSIPNTPGQMTVIPHANSMTP